MNFSSTDPAARIFGNPLLKFWQKKWGVQGYWTWFTNSMDA